MGFYDTLAVMMVDLLAFTSLGPSCFSPWHRKKKRKYPWIKTALHLFLVCTEFVEGRLDLFGYTFALFSMIPGSRGGIPAPDLVLDLFVSIYWYIVYDLLARHVEPRSVRFPSDGGLR